ncbi:MAG: hypothetical protein WAO27_08075 [Limnochordia bacterium]
MNDRWMRALSELRDTLARVPKDTDLQNIINARDEVFTRYQSIFSLNNLPNLSVEELAQSFILKTISTGVVFTAM